MAPFFVRAQTLDLPSDAGFDGVVRDYIRENPDAVNLSVKA